MFFFNSLSFFETEHCITRDIERVPARAYHIEEVRALSVKVVESEGLFNPDTTRL